MPTTVRTHLTDVWLAVITLPSAKAWWRCLLVYAVFIACALPLGLASGLLRPGLAPLRPAMFALLPIYLLLRPALVEELVFRALLLPRDTTRVSRWRLIMVSVVALAVFVVSHPLHAWISRPAALELFTNPVFLACAALLGIMCTLAYLISRSLWPPVFLHWITVVAWILFLGGQGLLGTPLDASLGIR